MAKATERKVVKKVPGVGVLYSDGSIRCDMMRASYPHVGEAQQNTNDDGKVTESYSITLLGPKETHGPLMQMCKGMIDGFEADMTRKGKGKNGRPFKYPASRKFIKNGDAKDEDGNDLFADNPEYANHWVITARSPDMPQLRGSGKDPETGKPVRLTPQQAKRMIYPGCYVSALIRPWAMDNKYGIRANAEILAVQFKKKGEPFGNGKRIDEDEIDDSLDADDGDDDDLGGDAGGWDDDNDM